jgi:hypothetical protein
MTRKLPTPLPTREQADKAFANYMRNVAMANAMQEIQLGNKVRCIVTGLTGIATSRVEYLNGCEQICVTPSVKNDGEPKHYYVDVNQLEVVGKGIAVQPKRTGGPQSNAPRGAYTG